MYCMYYIYIFVYTAFVGIGVRREGGRKEGGGDKDWVGKEEEV